MGIDVLLSITIPVLSSYDILMLNSCLWVRKQVWVRLENLVVGVLNFNVLLLNYGFHSLVILEVKTFLCDRLQVIDYLICLSIFVLLYEALSSINHNRLILQVFPDLLSCSTLNFLFCFQVLGRNPCTCFKDNAGLKMSTLAAAAALLNSLA